MSTDDASQQWNGQYAWKFAYVTTGNVYSLAIVLPILATVAVSLRFYVRRARKVGLGLDDWFLLPALTLFIGVCIVFLIGAANGVMGVNAPPTQLTTPNPLHEYILPLNPLFAKLQFSYQILSLLANCFVKLSIVSLYQRVFVTSPKSGFDIACRITHGTTLAWTLCFLLLAILACPSSPAAQWSPRASQQEIRCTTAFGAGEAAAISDLVLDAWLVALPQWRVWQLQMSGARRAMVSGVMALGLSCVAFSAARVAIFADLHAASAARQPLDRDQVVAVNVWFGALDAGMALIVACLPPLRPLVAGTAWKKLVSDITGSSRSRSARSEASVRAVKSKRMTVDTMDDEDEMYGRGGVGGAWRRFSRSMFRQSRDAENGEARHWRVDAEKGDNDHVAQQNSAGGRRSLGTPLIGAGGSRWDTDDETPRPSPRFDHEQHS